MECWLSIRTVGIIPLDSRLRMRKDFHRRIVANGHAASACSLDVTLHYYKVIRGAAAPFGRCVIAQL